MTGVPKWEHFTLHPGLVTDYFLPVAYKRLNGGWVLLSRATQYAIRAMIFLALQPPGKLSGAQEIASTQHIPKPFLWKVLHRLQRKKLVRSFKGVGGGYELAQPAGQIRLNRVVAAFENKPIFQGCLFGLSQCSETAPCPMESGCVKLENEVLKLLRSTTIGDFAIRPGGVRRAVSVPAQRAMKSASQRANLSL